MELNVLSKDNLKILSVCKVSDYEINLDEETNAKSTFTVIKDEGLKKGNYIVLNGLYKQFLFIIDEVQTEKSSNVSTITALEISNMFNRKVIEKNTDDMKTKSIEEFIANTMYENFVNSDDTKLNIGYIDIIWHTNTQAVVETNAENGLYNFHTFLINCRQNKNIYTDFKFEDKRLKIDIENKEETEKMIDTTLSEVTDYNKIYEEDATAKVTVLIRENNTEYNLYLKTDRTTTTNKDDPDRANGKIEVISVDTADKAAEEAMNIMKGNRYNHLVEFKIAKTSKTMNISEFFVGRPVLIKTDDDIYSSYISAITLKDENFVYFKSGKLRLDFLDKLKSKPSFQGNKLDKTGGVILGNLHIDGNVTCSKSIPHRSLATAVTNRAVYTLPTAWTFTSLPVHGWSNMIINHLVNDELSIANNAVRIGKNVSKVLVSAQIQAITTTTPAINTYNLTVLKNGLNYLNFAYRSTNIYSEYWSPMQTNPQLLNVSEGDLITIGLLGGNPIDVEILTATLVIEVIY